MSIQVLHSALPCGRPFHTNTFILQGFCTVTQQRFDYFSHTPVSMLGGNVGFSVLLIVVNNYTGENLPRCYSLVSWGTIKLNILMKVFHKYKL